MRYHSSKQPKGRKVPYVTRMDPLSCQAKVEVMQPLCVCATKPPIKRLNSIKVEKMMSCSKDIWRLHDLNLCLTT